MQRAARLKRKTYADRRGTRTQRGYDNTWLKVRRMKLKRDPLCEDCLPHVTPAREVHHKEKIAKRPELRLVLSNLMSLCIPCHAVRTARGE